MNRSRLTLLIIIAVVIIGGFISLAVWKYMASFYAVHFNNPQSVAISIYKIVDSKNQTIEEANSSISLSLQSGDYCAAPTDANYDNTPICFTINDKPRTITINPDYSTSKLNDLLSSHLVTQLQSIISARYSPIIANYKLAPGKLYGKGQWYGTTLTTIVAPQDRGDVYRTVLEKVNDSWKIVAPPQIVLDKYTNPGIPTNILTAVNQQTGTF